MMAGIGRGHARALAIPKASKSSLNGRLLLGTAAIALLAQPAHANPVGGTVSTGSASTSSSSSRTTVDQKSEDVVINWSSFNIGSGQTTNFVQPNSSAIAVNRIGSASASQILGTLDANGRIVLINGNGVLFGKGAQVNVGSLIATSTDGSDSDVLSGKFTKAGSQNASVVNQGTLTAASGGTVALVAPNVSNSGIVSAKLGTVSLGAANAFTVDLNGDGLVSFAAQGDVNGKASAINTGSLVGAHVAMTAHAAEGIATGVVTTSGFIQAEGVSQSGGTIFLDAGNGALTTSGTLNAAGANGGGQIETSGAHVSIAGAISAGKGGKWIIDPDDLTIDSAAATTIDASLNSGNAVELQTTATTTSAPPGNATAGVGDINIDSALSWHTGAMLTIDAYHSINILAPISITGAGQLVLQYNDEATDGVLNFGLTSEGFTGNISYGATNNGGTLTINNTSYTLEYSLASLATDIGTNGNGSFALANSYDASGDGTYSFSPMDEGFSGTFNGLGNTISNLTISSGEGLNVGLFGTINSGGTVANIGLVGGSVTNTNSNASVGGLVGFNDGGTVTDAYAAIGVSSTGGLAGGLVGDNDGVIADSYATGTVSGDKAGGLVGFNLDTITQAYATGGVTGSTYAGGLVGLSVGGAITDVYATGAASGGTSGGLLGSADVTHITDAYATGASSGGTTGGLVGSSGGSVYTNDYWDLATSGITATSQGVGGIPNEGGVTGESTAGLASSAILTALNSGGTAWGNAGNQTTPYLPSNPGPVFLGTDSSATPTVYNPILNVQQLQNIDNALSSNFVLVQNIDASGYGFVPVGVTTAFTGIFDGLGNTIANLTIDTAQSDAGLFAQLGGTVENLGLTNVDIETTAATAAEPGIGALAGFSYGTITNVYSTGTVTANLPLDYNTDAGGLVGYLDFGTISNSYSTANVTADATGSGVGGLVGGDLFGGNILSSHASGSVTGGDNASVGGLVGFVYESATVSNSFATGNVSEGDSGYAGGLIGDLYAGSVSKSFASGNVIGGGNGEYGGFDGNTNGAITQSYATGIVSKSDAVTGGNFGGFSGGQDVSGSIAQSYATGAVTADSTATIGGFIGANGGTINESYSSGVVTGGAANQAGGFVGSNNNAGIIGNTTEAYYNSTGNGSLSGVGTNTGGAVTIGAIADMTNASNFVAWNDFGTAPGGASGQVWVIVDQDGSLNNAASAAGGTTPMLLSEYSTTIFSAHQLQLMALAKGATYTLGDSINAAGTAGGDVWSATGFIPVGGNNAANFTGTFNGAGYTISNLTIDSSQAYAGLFGKIGSAGTVGNVGLLGGSVTGSASGADIGMVAGDNSGTIIGAYATGAVTGTAGSANVGGLVGDNDTGSTITYAFASGAVGDSSTSDVGGLAGSNYGTITASFATGAVSGTGSLGGLVGYNSNIIMNDYAMGAVSGDTITTYVGGLVGDNLDSITDAYSTGPVSVGDFTGGLVGMSSGGTVTDGYWDSKTSDEFSADGGATLKTTALLQAGLPSGFSNSVWGTGTDLYPYLIWQSPTGTPQSISGFVSAGSNRVSGENVGLLINGVAATPGLAMTSGANGYYYDLLAPGTISAGGSNVVAYLDSGTPANTWVQNATGSTVGVNLVEGDFVMASAASDSNAILSGLSSALGSASGPQFLYTASSGIVQGVNLVIYDTASSFTLDSALDVGNATLTLYTTGSDTQNGGAISANELESYSTGGLSLTSATNSIAELGTVGNVGTGGIAITDAAALTVAGIISTGSSSNSAITLTTTGTGNGLTINDHLTGGTVDLVSAGTISEGTTGYVDAGTLEGSSHGSATFLGWNQVGALGDFTTNGHGILDLYDFVSLDVTGTVNTAAHTIKLVDEVGNLDITGTLDGGTVTLDSVAGEVQGAGTIDANLINVAADTGIDLDGTNDIVAIGTDTTTSGSNVIDQH